MLWVPKIDITDRRDDRAFSLISDDDGAVKNTLASELVGLSAQDVRGQVLNGAVEGRG
jgi:hypothetical protein